VGAIAPYLRHPIPAVRAHAAESLRITQNPAAVPFLKAALIEFESRLPSVLVADPETEASIETLTSCFRALSMIRSEDALSALDASVSRLRQRFSGAEVGIELIRQLQFIRETGGVQGYRRERDARSHVPQTTQPTGRVNDRHPPSPVKGAMSEESLSKADETLASHWPWVIGGILTLFGLIVLASKHRNA
jgi:hypothetical protein